MYIIQTIIILFTQLSFSENIKPGTYSLATEAGWTAWFELKPNGSALISPAYDTEKFDPVVAKAKNPKPIQGTWKNTTDGIELTYGNVTDTFKFDSHCKDWNSHPCFNFMHSKTSTHQKSALEYKQPFVNWNIKMTSRKIITKLELDKCKNECHELLLSRKLKNGMDEKSCISQLCKP